MNKQLLTFYFTFCVGVLLHAQVKIGDNPTTIDASSLLELESTNQGLLLPRLALAATNNAAPLTGAVHVQGMVVYNTATAGTAPNNVIPGYYYNDGTQWLRLATEADIDLRLVGTSNHITADAGVGGTGTDAGTGSNNIAIGDGTGNALTTGSSNVLMGFEAGGSISNSSGNVILGDSAGTLLSGNDGLNVFIGNNAGRNTNSSDAEANVFIGWNAGSDAGTGPGTIGFNTIVGAQAFRNNAEGSSNVVMGNNAFFLGTQGENNTLIGANALQDANGSENAILGGQTASGNFGATVNGNVVLGHGAAGGIQSDNNIIIGHDAGVGTTFPGIMGARNILIGERTILPDPTASNQLAIGNLIFGTNLNGTNNTISAGNIGIGTNAPTQRLEVNGNVMADSFIAPGMTYADYVFEAAKGEISEYNTEYRFKTLAEVESFIAANNHLPGVTSIKELNRDKEGNYLVNISALSNQLLEKVEELYLHTIEQEKEIEQLKKRLEKIEDALLNKN